MNPCDQNLRRHHRTRSFLQSLLSEALNLAYLQREGVAAVDNTDVAVAADAAAYAVVATYCDLQEQTQTAFLGTPAAPAESIGFLSLASFQTL